MITKNLTAHIAQRPSETLLLRHFHFQNKFKRGNLQKVGVILLRYFCNSLDGKINYSALVSQGITQRQAEKFISILRKDGWLLNKNRGYAHINYPKILELESELNKYGFLWGFRAADNDVIWNFRRKAHDICLKKGKTSQAAKIWRYTNEEIRLKILSMIGKGYKVSFQSVEHFINYMAKFLEFELNTKKFLEWAIKKIKEKGEQVIDLVNKTPTALQAFLKSLNHTVSYIGKIKKTLVFNINGLGREEKENKIKEKEMRLTDEEMLHLIMGKPKAPIDIIGHLTVKLCQEACGFAKRYNKWFESDFTTMGVRGMMMNIIEQRKQDRKPPLVFYSAKQLEKYLIDRLREEKRPNWALEKFNVEEYEERDEFIEEQEKHDKQYDRWRDNLSTEEAYFKRSAEAYSEHDPHYCPAKSMGDVIGNILRLNKQDC